MDVACRNCLHTMNKLLGSIPFDVWWCPKCGTLKSVDSESKCVWNIPELMPCVKDLKP